MAEQALVGRNADPGALNLSGTGLAPELPGELADLGDGLGGHRLSGGNPPQQRRLGRR